MLRKISAKNQFAGFVAAGAIAAAANFGSRVLLNPFLGYAAAIVVAFCIGLSTAFLLNRQLVFPATEKPVSVEFGWFLTVNLLALGQTIAVSLYLADYLLPRIGITAFAKELAHFAGILVPVASSYLGHKYWTFSTRKLVR